MAQVQEHQLGLKRYCQPRRIRNGVVGYGKEIRENNKGSIHSEAEKSTGEITRVSSAPKPQEAQSPQVPEAGAWIAGDPR
ncbi:hypothetical protein GCM10027346_40290 [Hymenobacter seoulensis]